MKHVTRENNFLIIHNTHKSKSFVRLMKSKKAVYQASLGTYKIPYTKGCWREFEELGYEIPKYVKQEITLEKYMRTLYLNVRLPETITKKLFPYQIEGVKMLEAGYSLLADQQGLGKTPQSCRYLELHDEYNTNIIVCPGFLKEKWKQEIEKWTSKQPIIIYGRTAIEPQKGYTYIINYDILSYHVESLIELDLDVIISDEVHYCKNSQSKRTKALKELVEFSKKFIALSGTPILNNPMEIYSTLNTLDPFQFYSPTLFANTYCKSINVFGKEQFIGSKNETELYNKLKRSIMIRRTYDEVKKEFGDTYNTKIIHDIIPIELKNYTEYKDADDDLITYVEQTEGMEKACKIEKAKELHRPRILKEIIYKNKRDQIFKWIDNFLLSDEKICLFFSRTKHLQEFIEKYDRMAIKINGEVDTEKRFGLCNRFNRSRRLKVLCGNIQACGVGLDLIGSHTICFVDFDWNFSNMEQVIKRADRFGQKSPIVNVYYFAGKNTIEDDYIMTKLDKKNEIAKQIIDGRKLKSKEKFKNNFK